VPNGTVPEHLETIGSRVVTENEAFEFLYNELRMSLISVLRRYHNPVMPRVTAKAGKPKERRLLQFLLSQMSYQAQDRYVVSVIYCDAADSHG
jgi:hypothetical protein